MVEFGPAARVANPVPDWRRVERSSRCAIIKFEHSAQTLAALDRACAVTGFFARVDELVLQALMIPLGVVMSQVLASRSPQRGRKGDITDFCFSAAR